MALSLPGNADLEHLRRDARRLQRGVRSGDARARDLAARHHPAGPPDDPGTYALSDAQLVVARAYGFASWPRLVAYLRVAESLSRDPAPLDPDALNPDGSATESAAVVAALACLTYTDRDEPERWHRAAELLSTDPGLVDRDVHVAAAAGDVDALRAHLAADPSAATRQGGPFGWAPLLYVVYSRMPQRAPLDSARLLLDAGADPDSGYLWQGLFPPFTALTGVFGEGENGPSRQPRHRQWRDLAELLLERGADPNDRQTLYNRMFGRDDSHLELLLRHGLGRPPPRCGHAAPVCRPRPSTRCLPASSTGRPTTVSPTGSPSSHVTGSSIAQGCPPVNALIPTGARQSVGHQPWAAVSVGCRRPRRCARPRHAGATSRPGMQVARRCITRLSWAMSSWSGPCSTPERTRRPATTCTGRGPSSGPVGRAPKTQSGCSRASRPTPQTPQTPQTRPGEPVSPGRRCGRPGLPHALSAVPPWRPDGAYG